MNFIGLLPLVQWFGSYMIAFCAGSANLFKRLIVVDPESPDEQSSLFLNAVEDRCRK